MVRPPFLLILALLVPLVPLQAPSQETSTEDKAALILYQSGREKFKSENYDEAAKDLGKAFALAPNVFIQYYLGIALQKAGRFDEAQPLLEGLAGKLERDQEHERLRALTQCILAKVEPLKRASDCERATAELQSIRWQLDDDLDLRRAELAGACDVEAAWRQMEAGKCRDAINRMNALAIPLMPANNDLRTQILRDCKIRIAGFSPESTEQKAAFLLVQDGTALLDDGHVDEGIRKLELALQILDEPHIHMHLARANSTVFHCDAVAAHARAAISALPEAREEMQELQEQCAMFEIPASATLEPAVRSRLQDEYRTALSAPDPVPGLMHTLETYDNPRIRIFIAGWLNGKRHWKEALDLLDPLTGGEWEADSRVAQIRELARFALLDENHESRKETIFNDYRKARTALDDSRWAEARKLLEPISANPYVVLALVKIAASTRDCEFIGPKVPYIVQRLPEQEKRLARMADDCRVSVVASQRAERAERERTESLAVSQRSLSDGKRTAGSAVLMAFGVASLATSGVMFWQYYEGKSKASSALQRYRGSGALPVVTAARGDYLSARKSCQMYSALGYSLAGVGVGLAIWGIVDYVQIHSSARPTPRAVVVPAGGTGQGGLVVSGRF